jgi:hypothetical protein
MPPLITEDITHDLTLRVYTPTQILLDGAAEDDEPVFELQSRLGKMMGIGMEGTVLISMTHIPRLIASLNKSFQASDILHVLWCAERPDEPDAKRIEATSQDHLLHPPRLSAYARGFLQGLLFGVVLVLLLVFSWAFFF